MSSLLNMTFAVKEWQLGFCTWI